jgi:hypothetical protein
MAEEMPLDFILTLGRDDPLLPRAKAIDFLKNRYSDTIHEIGSGNFHFARTFTDEVQSGIAGLAYNCHDISDITFNLLQEKLAPYQGKINFHKSSLKDFPDDSGDGGLEALLVEVIDDTLTEFFVMHDGKTYILTVRPEMKEGMMCPSLSLAAKRRIEGGDFTKPIQNLVAKGIDREYSSSEIIGFMDTNRWKELENVYPSFLAHIQYKCKEFIPMDINEYMYRYHWKDTSSSFKEYADAILTSYKKQLASVEHADTSEPVVVSLPVEGLNFLWKIKDRKKVNVDFFDYGYDSVEKKIIAYSVHTGQITAPVNFEIMKYAAEALGFKTKLERDHEYIKEHLGHDTIRLNYAARAVQDSIRPDKLGDFMYDMFYNPVKALCPDARCTAANIMGFRVQRLDYEVYLQAGKDEGIIKPDFCVDEGSYHLKIYK